MNEEQYHSPGTLFSFDNFITFVLHRIPTQYFRGYIMIYNSSNEQFNLYDDGIDVQSRDKILAP